MSHLIKKSHIDIEIAKKLLTPEFNPTNDEMITDQAAYHAQQGIEKLLKYAIEMKGIRYSRTHNLIDLISTLEREGFEVDNELKINAFKITLWEAQSRYEDDFSVVRSEIENAFVLYEKLLQKVLSDLEDEINEKGTYS